MASERSDGQARQGGAFRLRNVRLRSKLGLILIIPIVGLLVLATGQLVGDGRQALNASNAKAVAQLSASGSALVHQLQRERAAASLYLAAVGAGTDTDDLATGYRQQWRATDQAVHDYQDRRGKLRGTPGSLASALNAIDSGVADANRLRNEVLSGKVTLSSAVFQYRILIAALLEFRSEISEIVQTSEEVSEVRASSALSQVKEDVSLEQLVVLRTSAAGNRFTPELQQQFISTITGQQESMLTFQQTATPGAQSSLNRALAGSQVQTADQLAGQVSRTQPNQTLALSQPLSTWNSSMAARGDLLRGVEKDLDSTLIAHTSDTYDGEVRQELVEAGAVLLVLFLAVLLGLLMARSMARSLGRLRGGALQVAYESLPQAVARLRDAPDVGGLTPDEVASQVRDPVRVQGRDEIGQVSQAFNVVHREAVRVAAEQASLRASVSTMFVNLARRSQLLVDRLIGHLDGLEQGEEDPDRLSQLFQLDHLATRMRRNDENLLVLAGADSSRARREAAPLGDVLRASQSEVEQYTRIEFGTVDNDVMVSAGAVNDVVHLVAELLDNATAFSSPETPVVVDGARVGDRVIIQVSDQGIGMNDELLAELNERLANPPLVDVAVSRMMGLVVVGRLADRLGVKVELRAAPGRGTVADVVMPAAILDLSQARRPQVEGTPYRMAVGAAPEVPDYPPAEYPVEDTWAPADSVDPNWTPANSRGPSRSPEPPPVRQDTPNWQPSADAPLPRRDRRTPADETPALRSGTGSGADGQWPGWSAESPNGGSTARHGAPADRQPEAAPVTGPPAGPAGPDGAGMVPHDVDDTRELSIFRSVESNWFRTEPARPGDPAAPAEERTAQLRRRPSPGGQPPVSGPPSAPPATPPAENPSDPWNTAADVGWRRAAHAYEEPSETTSTGLPRRRPMEQLVPGSVSPPERPATPTRSPDRVRGLLSAYHRGVQRGRGANGGDR